MSVRPVPKPARPAKKPRAWNSTLAVAEPKATPKKKLTAEGTPQRGNLTRNPLRRKSRPASETERIYGTPEFRDFLHSHCCIWCGRSGVEQAHLRGNDGTGRKKDWTTTGPLCGARAVFLSGIPCCHDRFDRTCAERFWFTDAQRTSLLLRLDAFHAAWQSHLNGERK
jgi:hypothetical protein